MRRHAFPSPSEDDDSGPSARSARRGASQNSTVYDWTRVRKDSRRSRVLLTLRLRRRGQKPA